MHAGFSLYHCSKLRSADIVALFPSLHGTATFSSVSDGAMAILDDEEEDDGR
jgi:hypothetical protein